MGIMKILKIDCAHCTRWHAVWAKNW